MPEWITHNPIRFPINAMRFLIRKEGPLYAKIQHAAFDAEDDPSRLAETLLEIVCRFKPHLREATIEMFGFDVSYGCWYIVAVHPSLPRWDYGNIIDHEFLDLPTEQQT